MKRHFMHGLIGGLLMATVTTWAQSGRVPLPASPTPAISPPAATAPPRPKSAPVPAGTRAAAKPVTIEGCVVEEKDAPGRKPSVTERAGLGEDYVLVDTKIISGSNPSPSAPPMFEIEGISHDTLKTHLGQRVQLQGTFGSIDSGLVEIRATSIKPLSGECAARAVD